RNCVEVGIVVLAACKFSLRQTGSTSTQVTKVHGFAVSESKLGLPHRSLRAVRFGSSQLRRGWDCCASGMQVFVETNWKHKHTSHKGPRFRSQRQSRVEIGTPSSRFASCAV